MKPYLFVLLLLVSSFSFGQLFTRGNIWSVGFNLGSQDVMSHTNSKSTRFYQPTSFHANGRYMINSWFGVQANLGYQLFIQEEPTHVNYATLTGAAVFDLSELTSGYISWPNGFRVLGHVDGGYATMWKRNYFQDLNISPNTPLFNSNDEVFVASIGLTPEYRITPNWMINFDVTFVQHILQDMYFDWSEMIRPRGLKGSFMRFSFGVTHYFGKEKTKASMN